MSLEESGLAAQKGGPVSIAELVELVDETLDPCMLRLDQSDHLAQLVPDDTELHQRLSKHFSLRRVRHRVLYTHSGTSMR
jgi:hypothetical protein